MHRHMRRFHRTMGALIAVFVILLAVTGILLNHTEDLELDQQYLDWPWLLDHYGIANVEPDNAFLLDQLVVTQFDKQLFIDDKPLIDIQRPLVGAVQLEDIIVLATDDGLVLLTPEGEFIEKMTGAMGIPAMIQNIGMFHGDPVLQTKSGMWRSDFLLDTWEPVSLEGISWSQPSNLPGQVEQQLREYFHGKGISVERLVLDIHNGHIMDKFGVWLLDGFALLMVLLSISGIFIWLRSL